MYGYLKPDAAETSPAVRGRYRRYYCTLCHALWQYYGRLSRLMVSYDMTFAAVVLSPRFPLPAGKNRCLKKRTLTDPESNWKKLAALTVILAAGKLEDDIADDHSIPARLARACMGRTIRKAERDYPAAYRAVAGKMALFHSMETEKRDMQALSSCFSDVIAEGVRSLFPDLNRQEEAILRYVTGWIYFIDAVDDLDEDRRKQKPNPFIPLVSSREELLTRQEEEIRRFADDQVRKLRAALQDMDFSSADGLITAAVINGTIPAVTGRIFSLISGYPQAGAFPPRRRGGVLYG